MSRVLPLGTEREATEFLRKLDKLQKLVDSQVLRRDLGSQPPESLQLLWYSLGTLSQSFDMMFAFQTTLQRGLDNTDPVTRCFAASMLSRMDANLKPALLLSVAEQGLDATDVLCRRNAARIMFDLKAKGAPLLSKALLDKDEVVRNWALKLIQTLGKDAQPAIPALVEMVKQIPVTMGSEIPDIQLRADACDLLADFGSSAASAAKTLQLICDERIDAEDNRYLRLRAARALYKVSGNVKPALKVVSEILDSRNAKTRVDESGTPIDDGSYWPRVWAYGLLTELGKEAQSLSSKVDKLLKEEENLTVRQAAEEALKAIGK